MAYIDDKDFPKVGKYKWYTRRVKKRRDCFYAVRKQTINGKEYTYFLHIELMKVSKGMCVDHIDGNGLNCLRTNMRECTRRQNAMNRRKLVQSISKFKGVTFRKREKKPWIARIGKNGYKFLGYYSSEIEAAKVYDVAALLLFGKFANLNFPRKND